MTKRSFEDDYEVSGLTVEDDKTININEEAGRMMEKSRRIYSKDHEDLSWLHH